MAAFLPILALAALAAAASSSPTTRRHRPLKPDVRPPHGRGGKPPRLEVVHAPGEAERLAKKLKDELLRKGKAAVVNAAKAHADALKKAVENAKQGKPQVVSMTPALAAQALRAYLMQTHDFGSSAHKSANVAKMQSAMGMGSDAIGIVGPKTRALALVLGVVLPPRPGAAAKNKAAVVRALPPAASPVPSSLPVAPSQKQPFEYTDENARQVATRRGVDAPTKTDRQKRAQAALDAEKLRRKQLEQDASLAARAEHDGDLAAAARKAVATVAAYRKAHGASPAVKLADVSRFQLADGQLTNDGEYGPNARTAAAYYLGVPVASLPPVAAKWAKYPVTWKPHTN